MTGAVAIVEMADELGITLTADGQRILATPKSAATEEFVALVRQHKDEVLEFLSTPLLADALEAMLRLGQQLNAGDINAIHCGITGRECRTCKGVPCLGSGPWVEG